MDIETLRKTIDQLIVTFGPIAEKNLSRPVPKKDFENILVAAKKHLPDNELVQNMDSGTAEGIMVASLIQKLSILKTAIDEKTGEDEPLAPSWD